MCLSYALAGKGRICLYVAHTHTLICSHLQAVAESCGVGSCLFCLICLRAFWLFLANPGHTLKTSKNRVHTGYLSFVDMLVALENVPFYLSHLIRRLVSCYQSCMSVDHRATSPVGRTGAKEEVRKSHSLRQRFPPTNFPSPFL